LADPDAIRFLPRSIGRIPILQRTAQGDETHTENARPQFLVTTNARAAVAFSGANAAA
jgi:hypothetical protein